MTHRTASKRMPLLGVLLATLLRSGTVPAEEPTLSLGLGQYQDGFLDRAVLTLDAVIQLMANDPAAPHSDLVQAWVIKGAALVGLAQEKAARGAFLQALKIEPSLRLSKGQWAPRVIRVFDAARKGKSKSVLYASGGVGLGAVLAGVALAGGGAAAASTRLQPRAEPSPAPTPIPPGPQGQIESVSPPSGGTVTASPRAGYTNHWWLQRGPTVVVKVDFGPDPRCSNLIVDCQLEQNGTDSFTSYVVPPVTCVPGGSATVAVTNWMSTRSVMLPLVTDSMSCYAKSPSDRKRISHLLNIVSE